MCRWAAESLGSLAKKRQKSEGRGFHSHALRNAVAKGLQIDGSAADNVTISLVQALGRLARDWSDAPPTDEPGEDEVFLALGSFLNEITVRQSASPSVLSAPFFLSGGTKLALSLLRDAVVCYKRFCSNSDKARLWEDVCVEILRETRSKASSDEMVSHVAGDDDLYFGILSLLDEEVVEGLVKARAGTSGDSKERKLCLGEEVLLWIQELLFPIGCATQYEEWMSGLWEGCRVMSSGDRLLECVQHMSAKAIKKRDSKKKERLYLLQLIFSQGLAEGRPGVTAVLPWVVHCFDTVTSRPGQGVPTDDERRKTGSTITCKICLDGEEVEVCGGGRYFLSILVGLHLVHRTTECLSGGKHSPADRLASLAKALDALHSVYYVMEMKKLYHRVDDRQLRQLAVLSSFASHIAKTFSIDTIESLQEFSSAEKTQLCKGLLRCLMQMSKVDFRITGKEMTHIWCLVWLSKPGTEVESLDFEFLLSPFTSRRDSGGMVHTLYESVWKTFTIDTGTIEDHGFFQTLASVAQRSLPTAVPDMAEVICELWLDLIAKREFQSQQAYLSLTELFCTLLDNLRVVKQNAHQCSRVCKSIFDRMQKMDIWADLLSYGEKSAKSTFLSAIKDRSSMCLARTASAVRVHSSMLRIAVDCEMTGYGDLHTSEEPSFLSSQEVVDLASMPELAKKLLLVSANVSESGARPEDLIAHFSFVCCSLAIQYISIDALSRSFVGQNQTSKCVGDFGGAEHAAFVVSALTGQLLSQKDSHERWNGLVSSVRQANVQVAMYHLMSSTFSHWSGLMRGTHRPPSSATMDNFIAGTLRQACGGMEGGADKDFSSQLQVSALKLLDKAAKDENATLCGRLLHLMKKELDVTLLDARLMPLQSEKLRKYLKKDSSDAGLDERMSKLMKHALSWVKHRPAQCLHSKTLGAAYDALTCRKIRVLVHSLGICARNRGLGRETVQGICAYLVVVESTVITQIEMMVSSEDGLKAAGESQTLGPLFEILCSCRRSISSVLQQSAGLEPERVLRFEKWCMGSIASILSVIERDSGLGLCDEFLDFVAITFDIRSVEMHNEISELCAKFCDSKENEYFGCSNAFCNIVALKAISQALRCPQGVSELDTGAFHKFVERVVTEIVNLGEEISKCEESPKKKQKLGHTKISNGVVSELLFLESVLDVYSEIILVCFKKTLGEDDRETPVQEEATSILKHTQCTLSLLLTLKERVGAPTRNASGLSRLHLFVWRKFLHFLDVSVDTAIPKLTSGTGAMRHLTAFSKIRKYCEALVKESSSQGLTRPRQDNWSLTAFECFSGAPVSSMWLRARTQEKKCLRMQSSYADSHANFILNALTSSSDHKDLEGALATLISIVTWAPAMKLRVNTLGRILHLPLLLFSSKDGQEVELGLDCKSIASCCRLIHACIKFRGNQCRRSAALIIQSAACLQSALLSAEYLATQDASAALDVPSRSDSDGLGDNLRSAASYLSDLYKELADQSETFGKYLVHVLSSYITSEQNDLVLSGRSKSVLALESGICTLLGSCPAKDLKHLNSVFLGTPQSGNYMEKLKKLHAKFEMHYKYGGKK